VQILAKRQDKDKKDKQRVQARLLRDHSLAWKKRLLKTSKQNEHTESILIWIYFVST
jgi:hypothetical protein